MLAKHGIGLLITRQNGPQRLRRLLQDIGGTFLKYGQVLSLQPDILPREYCNALFDLLDKVPPFAYSEVERTFIEDLGACPDDLFDSFAPLPVASASIGQVHVAWLDQKKFAVKVRRPNVERVFSADLRIMGFFASAIERLQLGGLYWLARGIREFSSWTREELDYRYEARFMNALAYNARNNPREAVPALLSEYTTARILVAEYLDGPMVLDHIRSIEAGQSEPSAELEAFGFDPESFARAIVGNFVSDAFHNGLFHADLHPANLIILPDNVVGYVDFGITGSLSAYSRRNIVALTLALTRADPDAMFVHFMKIATTDPDSDVTAFRESLGRLVEGWFSTTSDLRQLRANITIVMLDMLNVSRATRVWPTPDVVRYIRSVITADGLITRFAPEMNVGEYLENVCEDYLRREMWQNWLNLESLADWTSTAMRLLRTGPATLSTLDAGQGLARAGRGRDRPSPRASVRVTQLAVITLVSVLLMFFSDQPEFGWNFFTAELALAGAAGTMVLVVARRLR